MTGRWLETPHGRVWCSSPDRIPDTPPGARGGGRAPQNTTQNRIPQTPLNPGGPAGCAIPEMPVSLPPAHLQIDAEAPTTAGIYGTQQIPGASVSVLLSEQRAPEATCSHPGQPPTPTPAASRSNASIVNADGNAPSVGSGAVAGMSSEAMQLPLTPGPTSGFVPRAAQPAAVGWMDPPHRATFCGNSDCRCCAQQMQCLQQAEVIASAVGAAAAAAATTAAAAAVSAAVAISMSTFREQVLLSIPEGSVPSSAASHAAAPSPASQQQSGPSPLSPQAPSIEVLCDGVFESGLEPISKKAKTSSGSSSTS